MESGNWLLYIIFGSLGIAWIVAVWRMLKIWSVILPAIAIMGYLISLGCGYLGWHSVANTFRTFAYFWGMGTTFLFFLPILSFLSPSFRAAAEQSKKDGEFQRRVWHMKQFGERQMRDINGH
ncbi:MAG: hypothetical protein IJ187_03505 [Neisseriaceae bacterium]|nr:hypothetical protein [Neisseriaceae bacterium]MBQ9724712.1 hypothetical protein [Neisseriaceae bacterium]